MATSEVWAEKVNNHYRVVSGKAIRLGQIEFNNLALAFIKTLRLYNKNANRHILYPQFIFRGRVYTCTEYSEPSKTGRGHTQYWTLEKTPASKLPVTWAMFGNGRGNVRVVDMTIPKSKVNSPDWVDYLE